MEPESWHHRWDNWFKGEATDQKDRSYIVCRLAYVLGGLIHAAWIFLFGYLDVWPLAYFNVGSALLFLVLYFLNEKGYRTLTLSLAVFEVVTHQIVAVILLGWNSGFQYYLVLALMLPFLVLRQLFGLKIFLSTISIGTFLYLEIFWHEVAPVHALTNEFIRFFSLSNIVAVAGIIAIWTHFFNTFADQSMHEAEEQRGKIEALLRNILPVPVVQRLKEGHSVIADSHPEVTVLFADIVGFTETAERMKAQDLVILLNQLFSAYDDITDRYGLEKIKTIGDAYMVAAGLPTPRKDHAHSVALFALDLLDTIDDFNSRTGHNIRVRIGIHSGPVIAGVIAKKKLIYDLWGDTVNIADRMQSSGVAGSIQITAATHALLGSQFISEVRGVIEVKGKAPMTTYWLKARRSQQKSADNQASPKLEAS